VPYLFLFITDSLEQSGLHLLRAFAQHALDRRENQVHILCYEHPIMKMKTGLRNSGEDHVHFHDCFTDHRGWLISKFSEMCLCWPH
jgi:hypothetical protein